MDHEVSNVIRVNHCIACNFFKKVIYNTTIIPGEERDPICIECLEAIIYE